ncbi:hypothetical protein F5888DRAFT_1617457, partial [Russula emetica]
FAFEIGSGLPKEVRRLQDLLTERDKVIQNMKEEKDDLEKSLEGLRSGLSNCKSRAPVNQYKEENRNIGIILRVLRIQFSDSQATVQRLEIEKKRLARQLNEACDASDPYENEDQWLKMAEGTRRTGSKAGS